MKPIDPITRRSFLRCLTAVGGALCTTGLSGCDDTNADSPPAPPPPRDADVAKLQAVHQEAHQLRAGHEQIAILIYPGFTELDAFGPRYALAGMVGAKVLFVAKSMDPVVSESGIAITPQVDFARCPQPLDLLVVPGGMTGTLQAMTDETTLGFVKASSAKAKLVGSVCTGSLILGAAGLLKGYTATTHWQLMDLLPLVGAKPSTDRVVFDRDRVTGGGVTAGLDFGFKLIQHYRGDFYAKGMQLLAQYDPQPPFPGGGNPSTADRAVVELLEHMHAPFVEMARKALTTQG